MHRGRSESRAVEKRQGTESRAAKAVGLLQDSVEYRGEAAWRGIDDLQHLGGRGLLLQRLARLVDEARVLHRNDRLRGKILQQRDFLIRKRPGLVSGYGNSAEQRI